MTPRAPRRPASKPVHPTAQRLIETAADVLEELGMDGFAGHEVLNRLGLTTGVLYYHFGDVEGLRDAALAHLYVRGGAADTAAAHAVLRQCSTLGEFRVGLRRVMADANDPERARRRLQRAGTLALSRDSDSLRRLVADEQYRLTGAVMDLIDEVADRGWLQPEWSPHALSVFIQACILGRIVDDVAEHHVDAQEWNSLIAHVIDRAILADVPG